MKRKRKATSTSSTSSKTSESSIKSPRPTSSEPNVKEPEEKKNSVKEDERKMEDQDMEENDDHQPGPCQGLTDLQLNSTSLEVSSPLPLINAVLPDGQQGHHHDVYAGDHIVLLEASTIHIADRVSDGISSNPIRMLNESTGVMETTDISHRCPQETVLPATSVTETTDVSERCPQETVLTATCVIETTDISHRCLHETVMPATSVIETTDIIDRCAHETVMPVTSVTEITDISKKCPHETDMPATDMKTTENSDRCHHETDMPATNIKETTDISDRCHHETDLPATNIKETTDISDRCHHETDMPAISIMETADISERCHHETDLPAISIMETTDISERCHHETDLPAISIMETTDVSDKMSENFDFPLMDMEGIKGEINPNVCESGEASEMLISDPCIDRKVSVLTADPDLQASQKHQPQNPDLLNLPRTPEISQVQPGNSLSDLQDSQEIKMASSSSDRGLQGRDVEHLDSQPEEIWTPMTDQTLLCGMNITQSQQADVLGEEKLTNGLDLPDSQLLGAWEDSFSTPKTMENHISDPLTPPWHRQEIPAATTSSPNLPVISAPAQDTRGPPQRRREDATSTVQGLIVELSNINRLIMGTYRELRQKRTRHNGGRGTGRRRREM